ncbi:MAG TPA: hypothetical protein PLJ12_08060 [Planctomycetota bacterium]|nr:hypothetical protein [Planctomycetota bacterium]
MTPISLTAAAWLLGAVSLAGFGPQGSIVASGTQITPTQEPVRIEVSTTRTVDAQPVPATIECEATEAQTAPVPAQIQIVHESSEGQPSVVWQLHSESESDTQPVGPAAPSTPQRAVVIRSSGPKAGVQTMHPEAIAQERAELLERIERLQAENEVLQLKLAERNAGPARQVEDVRVLELDRANLHRMRAQEDAMRDQLNRARAQADRVRVETDLARAQAERVRAQADRVRAAQERVRVLVHERNQELDASGPQQVLLELQAQDAAGESAEHGTHKTQRRLEWHTAAPQDSAPSPTEKGHGTFRMSFGIESSAQQDGDSDEDGDEDGDASIEIMIMGEDGQAHSFQLDDLDGAAIAEMLGDPHQALETLVQSLGDLDGVDFEWSGEGLDGVLEELADSLGEHLEDLADDMDFEIEVDGPEGAWMVDGPELDGPEEDLHVFQVHGAPQGAQGLFGLGMVQAPSAPRAPGCSCDCSDCRTDHCPAEAPQATRLRVDSRMIQHGSLAVPPMPMHPQAPGAVRIFTQGGNVIFDSQGSAPRQGRVLIERKSAAPCCEDCDGPGCKQDDCDACESGSSDCDPVQIELHSFPLRMEGPPEPALPPHHGGVSHIDSLPLETLTGLLAVQGRPVQHDVRVTSSGEVAEREAILREVRELLAEMHQEVDSLRESVESVRSAIERDRSQGHSAPARVRNRRQ